MTLFTCAQTTYGTKGENFYQNGAEHATALDVNQCTRSGFLGPKVSESSPKASFLEEQEYFQNDLCWASSKIKVLAISMRPAISCPFKTANVS
jgi:hypothetical protein